MDKVTAVTLANGGRIPKTLTLWDFERMAAANQQQQQEAAYNGYLQRSVNLCGELEVKGAILDDLEGCTIKGNHNELAGTRIRIFGDDNEFRGVGAEIHGNNNRIYGDNCHVLGNDNYMEGRGGTVCGDNNTLKTSGITVIGNNNLVEDNDAIVDGVGNTILGTRTIITRPEDNHVIDLSSDASSVPSVSAPVPAPPSVPTKTKPATSNKRKQKAPSEPNAKRKRTKAASKESVSETLTCVVCKDAPRTIVVMPCKHFITCAECNQNMVHNDMRECPVCRTTISERINVIVS
jgi:hypothetical protein